MFYASCPNYVDEFKGKTSSSNHQRSFFPECVARVPVSFGGLGVRLCSRKVVSMSATVRNRLRERRKALHSGECIWSDPENV